MAYQPKLLEKVLRFYPGMHFLSGMELTKKFQEHMNEYKINIKQEEVLDIRNRRGIIVVKTNRGVYESRALIIGSGKRPKKLKVPGEEEFLGKGVNYCASCDAPFFKN